MASISVQQLRGQFTKKLGGVYKEATKPSGFLRSFFRTVTNGTRYISIEVQRGSEKVAVEVAVGTEGNMNRASRSTEKIFEPKMFDEKMDVTQLDIYDQLHVSEGGRIDESAYQRIMDTVMDEMLLLDAKIKRAEEVMCAQVLEDGIVQSSTTKNVDFKRKAGSKVDEGAGNYWTTATIDPFTAIIKGCKFIRTEGKTSSAIYNLLLGEEAATALLDNPIFQKKADIKDFNIIDVGMTGENTNGAVPLCKFQAGNYTIQAWTYPQYYDVSGVSTPYLNPKKFVLLPTQTNFTMQYGAVPMVMENKGGKFSGRVKAESVVYDYLDVPKAAHYYGVKTAFLPVPLAIDTIYTAQVIAS